MDSYPEYRVSFIPSVDIKVYAISTAKNKARKIEDKTPICSLTFRVPYHLITCLDGAPMEQSRV